MYFNNPIHKDSSHLLIHVNLFTHVIRRGKVNFFSREQVLANPWDILGDLLAIVHVRLVNFICGFIQDHQSCLIPEFTETLLHFLVYMVSHLFISHLELLSVNLRSCTIKVYLLGYSIWNRLARTCKEWLSMVRLVSMSVVEIQSLWGLHCFIWWFVYIKLRVWDELIFTFILHRIITLSSRVTRDMYMLLVYLTFARLLLWIKLHFAIYVVTSPWYDQTTFWTLVVAIEIRSIGNWVQFTSIGRICFRRVYSMKSVGISG